MERIHIAPYLDFGIRENEIKRVKTSALSGKALAISLSEIQDSR